MQNTKSLFFTWDDGTTCRLCRIGLYSIGLPWKSYIPVNRHFGKSDSLCHGSDPGPPMRKIPKMQLTSQNCTTRAHLLAWWKICLETQKQIQKSGMGGERGVSSQKQATKTAPCERWALQALGLFPITCSQCVSAAHSSIRLSTTAGKRVKTHRNCTRTSGGNFSQ